MYDSYKKAFYVLLGVWQSAEAEVDKLRTENEQLRRELHAAKNRDAKDDKQDGAGT